MDKMLYSGNFIIVINLVSRKNILKQEHTLNKLIKKLLVDKNIVTRNEELLKHVFSLEKCQYLLI